MNNGTQKWDRVQLTAAIVVSAVSFLIVIARHVWPRVIVLDQPILGLLALAALPWLTLFFKKFKIPGIGEAETQDRAEGTTENPLPSPATLQTLAVPAQPRPDTMKLLATLWRYQRQSFGDDTSKRWTFRVSETARDFPRFLAGLSEAIDRGWVAVPPETHQCMLTNEGLGYCGDSDAVKTYGNIWTS